MGPNGETQQFLGASRGGQEAMAQPLAAPTSIVPTPATGGFSVAFGGLSTLAESYIVEYYPTGTPTVRTNKEGSGSPIVVSGLTAGAHTLHVRALAKEYREDYEFIQGPWSSGVNVTVL